MSEQSPGDSGRPTAPASSSDVQRSQRNAQNRRGNNQPRVGGKEESLKGFVYDVGPNKGGSELFTKTTREIAEYVATNYIGASDFRNGMVDLNLQPVRPPTDPTDPHDQVAFEKWKRANATYERQYEERRKLAGRVFSLVIGQCTQGMSVDRKTNLS